jgi:hypothetical protein
MRELIHMGDWIYDHRLDLWCVVILALALAWLERAAFGVGSSASAMTPGGSSIFRARIRAASDAPAGADAAGEDDQAWLS